MSQLIGIRDREVVTLGVLEQDTDEFATMLLPDLVKIDFVSFEEFFACLHVVRQKRYFGKKV